MKTKVIVKERDEHVKIEIELSNNKTLIIEAFDNDSMVTINSPDGALRIAPFMTNEINIEIKD